MSYQYPSGFPGYPGYPGGDPSYPPGAQQGFPGGPFPPAAGGGAFPPAAGGGFPPAPGGGYPQAGGYPAPGGYPGGMPSYPGAPGFGAPAGGPGYGAPPGAPAYGVPGYGGPGFNAPAGGYGAPSAGGFGAPSAGGFGVPPAGGYGAPGGAPGYGGFSQPSSQSYGAGGPGQMPGQAPGGYPSGPAPAQPTPYAAAMTATQGTIKAAPNFDALSDAEKLRKAMKGFGTDEQTIIDVVANRSNDQRQKIKAAFKTAYGKDLIKDLKSELSGNVEELIIALFMPSTYYDAWSLYHAMKGAGTQERVLIEILCTRTNGEIRNIVACYKQEFGRDIEKDIRSDTSGHFERLLVSMCQGNRDENQNVNMQQAEQDAQRLYQAGEGKLGTDESSFNLVLASRSFPQLKAVAEAYARISKRDLLSVIGREFSGYIEDGLKAVLQCAINRPVFFADRLCRSMKGAGTDDSTLIRIIVTRSEIDLVQIKQAYVQMYQKSLSAAISSDTSGDYRRMLLAISGQ